MISFYRYDKMVDYLRNNEQSDFDFLKLLRRLKKIRRHELSYRVENYGKGRT